MFYSMLSSINRKRKEIIRSVSKFSNALVLLNSKNEILWLQRPDSGIWGGLWVLPLQFEKKILGKKVLSTSEEDSVFESENTLAEQIVDKWINDNELQALSVNDGLLESAPIKHTLTHFHWYLQPQKLVLEDQQSQQITELLKQAEISLAWLSANEAKQTLGLPKAMLKVLETPELCVI